MGWEDDWEANESEEIDHPDRVEKSEAKAQRHKRENGNADGPAGPSRTLVVGYSTHLAKDAIAELCEAFAGSGPGPPVHRPPPTLGSTGVHCAKALPGHLEMASFSSSCEDRETISNRSGYCRLLGLWKDA